MMCIVLAKANFMLTIFAIKQRGGNLEMNQGLCEVYHSLGPGMPRLKEPLPMYLA